MSSHCQCINWREQIILTKDDYVLITYNHWFQYSKDCQAIVRTIIQLQMPFNSFPFWMVFPFIFLIYWALHSKWNTGRKIFLIVTSYLLYMIWEPAYALVLLGVTLITFWGGHILCKHGSKEKKQKWQVLAKLVFDEFLAWDLSELQQRNPSWVRY